MDAEAWEYASRSVVVCECFHENFSFQALIIREKDLTLYRRKAQRTRMKLLVYLSSLILLICFSACQRPPYPPAIQQAEAWMETRPDSALHLLEGIADSLAMLPNEVQMYYHLLTIQAKDKQYIPHTSDSLINVIVEYYETYDNPNRLMQAYFYQGSTYRDMNDAPRALKAFHQAIGAGKSTENLTLLGQAYTQIGNLLSYQNIFDEALEAYRISLGIFQKQNQKNRIPLTTRNIARIYRSKNLYDSASFYYRQANQQAISLKDSKQINSISGELGCFYYNIGNIKEAKTMLLPLRKHRMVNVLLHLGYIYGDEGHLDSARFYLNQVLVHGNIHKQSSAYQYLSVLETKLGDTHRAAEYYRQYESLRDSIQRITNPYHVEKNHLAYNYQRLKEEKTALTKENQLYTYVIAVLILVTLGVISTLYYFWRKHQQTSCSYSFIDFTATPEYSLFYQIGMSEGKASEEDWNKLLKQFYAAYPTFVSQLESLENFSELSQQELRICYLTKMNFSNKMIAKLLCISDSAVSHSRTRIFYKLTGEDGNASKFAHFIGSL